MFDLAACGIVCYSLCGLAHPPSIGYVGLGLHSEKGGVASGSGVCIFYGG